MRSRLALAALSAASLSLPACACCRTPCAPSVPCAPAAEAEPAGAGARAERAKRLVEQARERTAYLPIKPEEEARAKVPSMKDYPVVPNLIRIGAAMPKTMEAEMKAWEALKREGTIDKKLLNEVFYVVSSGNECGH